MGLDVVSTCVPVDVSERGRRGRRPVEAESSVEFCNNSEARKRRYYANREDILQKCREDKALCPLCQIEFHRPYLKYHLSGRHKLEPCDVKRLFTTCTRDMHISTFFLKPDE